MLNVICGSGVIGKATGTFLEAHGEEVFYVDTNPDVVEKLKLQGKQASDIPPNQYDLFWICTHEKHVLNVLPLPSKPKNDRLDQLCKTSITIIRSTIPPEVINKIPYDNVVHMPEFLVEASPLEGTFFPDRVIIGANDINSRTTQFFANHISEFYEKEIKIVEMHISSAIKLIANMWLTTQIAFWNEIYHTLPENYNNSKQIIANLVALDKRISQYGTKLLGTPYGGKCFVKDTDHIINLTNSPFFKLIKERNNLWKAVQ